MGKHLFVAVWDTRRENKHETFSSGKIVLGCYISLWKVLILNNLKYSIQKGYMTMFKKHKIMLVGSHTYNTTLYLSY